MEKKEEYAVFINAGKGWAQYTIFQSLREAQLDFKQAKENGYTNLKLVQRTTTVNESEVYEERNGHLINGNPIFINR